LLAGTPFGPFAIAAGAATLAISLFSKGNDDAVKKNEELSDSINNLEAQLAKSFQEGKLLALDLKDLTEAEKRLKEIEIRNQTRGDLNIELSKKGVELQEVENKLIDANFKTTTERLEAEKLEKELIIERQKIATLIAREEINIKKIKEAQIQADKKAADARKKARDDAKKQREKDAQDAQKLTDSLIRDELQKQLTALDRVATKREADFTAKKQADAQTNAFILQSQAVLEQDKAALRKQFAEAEKLASQAIFSERAESELASEQEFLESKKRFETAKLELELESDRQIFAQTKRSEEEITEFEKNQNLEREKQEIDYQIKKLEIIKFFDKQISDERKDAIDKEIELLKKRAAGLGVVIQKEVEQTAPASPETFGDLLGIPKDTQKQIKAVQGALEQVTSEVSKAVAERVAILQKEVDFRNRRNSS
jgi:hypothetical protein